MADQCVNKQKNLADCTCTYSCSNRGLCCKCVAYHRAMKQIPGCFFTEEAEATYDRSYEYFAQTVR